jgi:hypothetical protein
MCLPLSSLTIHLSSYLDTWSRAGDFLPVTGNVRNSPDRTLFFLSTPLGPRCGLVPFAELIQEEFCSFHMPKSLYPHEGDP